MFWTSFLAGYETVLYNIAKFTVHTLELIGIIIIIIGSILTLIKVLSKIKKKESPNAIIALGRSLALALEVKMGAEIVNTVLIREVKELAVLAIVIALRAFLAVLIHWEIISEKKLDEAKQAAPDTKE